MRKKIGNAFAIVRIILQGALELVLALLVVYGLIVTIGQGIGLNQPSNEGNVEVFVRTNGVHTELCLPTDHGEFCWTNVLPVDDFNAPESIEYLSVGWGDKGFFLETPTWD